MGPRPRSGGKLAEKSARATGERSRQMRGYWILESSDGGSGGGKGEIGGSCARSLMECVVGLRCQCVSSVAYLILQWIVLSCYECTNQYKYMFIFDYLIFI